MTRFALSQMRSSRPWLDQAEHYAKGAKSCFAGDSAT